MGEVMTRGIINMPLEMVMGSINGIENYHSTAQSLLADYDALRAENAELVAALEFVAAKVKSSGRCHPGAVQYLLAEGLEAVDAALVKKELSE